MYAIIISMVLALYSMVLVDFTVVAQEISVNSDMMSSVQALYTAEGAAEAALSMVNARDISSRNLNFLTEKAIAGGDSKDEFLSFNEGANSFYINRNMDLNASDLNASESYNLNNRQTKNKIYLANGQTLDKKTYYGLEPLKSKSFVLKEIDNEDVFDEISFEYNQEEDSSDLLFEIFIFPQEGEAIDFKDFKKLKDGGNSSVQRIVINTKDTSHHSKSFDVEGSWSITPYFNINTTEYKNKIKLSGFNPLKHNYILHFQTLDNKPTHFKLNASLNGTAVMLPNMLQTIDVIGATSTALYQRIKIQRQSEESIMPGLNFAHFSDGSINK